MREEKGICIRERIAYGIATVSDKGQVAIPIDAREELGIKPGDKLLVLKRADNAGVILVKVEAMDKLLSKVQKDERFLSRLER